MTFLKDGDSINFQKASCTLDGCVKIYTSRVDSVASETGKLLSGLADSASKSEMQILLFHIAAQFINPWSRCSP
jgi:condensin complex subunit 2